MKLVEATCQIISPVDGPQMLKRIEAAGRTCYKSEDKITQDSAEKFVAMIIKRGHHSVLEHESVSVRVICNRGITHEIVRHRIAAYSQASTRYCNYSKGRFDGEISLIPNFEGLTDKQIARRMALYEYIEEVYMLESAEGVKPQQARDNLPICLQSEIVITYNLRQWVHFFTLRTDKAAHPQMVELMRPLLMEFRKLIPVIFDDIGWDRNYLKVSLPGKREGFTSCNSKSFSLDDWKTLGIITDFEWGNDDALSLILPKENKLVAAQLVKQNGGSLTAVAQSTFRKVSA